ncbi:M56 family metallopeptidase [Paludisphaera rhizosphaerae]|uniref:M56 family metallopeptidase n=1 Tax=Paludisphaera rhizosphaerae TaxID=2711216 RepID=UPI0013EA1E10|nr:M56 family metallopeptidase [Paludisphaera rhizosphaerae]
MSALFALPPESPFLRFTAVVLLQTSLAVAVAAAVSLFFRRRADARHAAWLGALAWAALCPIVVVLAAYSGASLGTLRLPLPSRRAAPVAETPLDASASRAIAEAPSELPRPTVLAPSSMPVAAAREAAPLAAPRPTWRPDLPVALAVVWLAGVGFGLIRIARMYRRLGVLARADERTPVRGREDVVEAARAALGASEFPAVLASSAIGEPLVVGLLKPTILLPARLAEDGTPEALRDVLIHEGAHVLRRDLWVGFLQRLVGAFYWPHPLIHLMNRELSRAREEACDDFVLRASRPADYARTLLAIAEAYRPVKPPFGLSLLGVRWSLADRIAGLLDPRRASMNVTSLATRAVIVLTLVIVGAATALVRLDGSAQAEEPKLAAAMPPAGGATIPGVLWSLQGVVVDEQGKPAAGVNVYTRSRRDGLRTRTRDDGAFTIPLEGRADVREFARSVVAESDDLTKSGIAVFDPPIIRMANRPIRIVLKPSRTVTVRVTDQAGAPVPDASTEVLSFWYENSARAGVDGIATIRFPADAEIIWVLALKSKVGFDYFENYKIAPGRVEHFDPLPQTVALTFRGATTVRARAVDSQGRGIPDAWFGPRDGAFPNKVDHCRLDYSEIAGIKTDEQGQGVCDWIPENFGGMFRFETPHHSGRAEFAFSAQRPAPADRTFKLLRDTELGGTVRFADGRPAPGLAVRLEAGPSPNAGKGVVSVRTDDQGRYRASVGPETTYMIEVDDPDWTSRSLHEVLLREDEPRGDLDLTLVKGTILEGRVVAGDEPRPVPNSGVTLIQEGDLLPQEFRRLSASRGTLRKGAVTGADGVYRFRVTPGSYQVKVMMNDAPLQVVVKDESEERRILPDMAQTPATEMSGIVVEVTPEGERPVPSARLWPVIRGRSGGFNPIRCDENGRFRGSWWLGPDKGIVFYASATPSLAGFVSPSRGAKEVKVVVAKAAIASGRVVDHNGKPVAGRGVGVTIDSGPDFAAAGHVGYGVTTDAEGRYRFGPVPVGAEGEARLTLSDVKSTHRLSTVIRFDAPTADDITLPDLVVPSQAAAE